MPRIPRIPRLPRMEPSSATQPQSPQKIIGDNGSSSPSSDHKAASNPKKPPALSTKKRKTKTPSQTCRKRPRTTEKWKTDCPGRAAAAAVGTAQLIWEGIPDEYLYLDGGWPQGWIKKVYVRGPRVDRYWYSPKLQYELRSVIQVERFISALAECNGDEQAALKIARNKYIASLVKGSHNFSQRR
jgi:hypothetical protein